MKHYKNMNNDIYAYDDAIGKDYITAKKEELGLTEITEDEAKAILTPLATLDGLKEFKLIEFEKFKNKEQEAPVKVRDLFFYGGRINGQKYKEAFDLAKMLGKETGTIAHTTGLVEVDEAFVTEILVAIGLATYQAWYKFQILAETIKNTTTTEDLEIITWG